LQEFMIAPVGAPTFREAVRWASETYHTLQSVLKAAGYTTGVGDEGGFAPNLKSNEEALNLILEAITKAGYKPGEQVGIFLDPAASEFFDTEKGKYVFKKSDKSERTPEEMVEFWAGWVRQYPIRSIEEVEELGTVPIFAGTAAKPWSTKMGLSPLTPLGQVGELIVSGPQVTRSYVTRTQWNALSKIADGDAVWHRIGDSGYLDRQDRFWFCGRVAHRVLTAEGPMYPVCCEAIFNEHSAIRRSALVGVGPAGRQRPVIVLEPHRGFMPKGAKQREALLAEIRQLAASNPLTAQITDFLLHPHFPVDIRHNAKIFREKLAVWAARRGEKKF